ncbi:hypothetical protein DENSPDRAFT_887055 [Dentipellis sp. KUC8613]|nr:hypothetical protein DENSPDRAFT_887055 [Dentipellis sp. KUC8613]
MCASSAASARCTPPPHALCTLRVPSTPSAPFVCRPRPPHAARRLRTPSAPSVRGQRHVHTVRRLCALSAISARPPPPPHTARRIRTPFAPFVHRPRPPRPPHAVHAICAPSGSAPCASAAVWALQRGLLCTLIRALRRRPAPYAPSSCPLPSGTLL